MQLKSFTTHRSPPTVSPWLTVSVFFIFILSWTILPTFIRHNLPPDLIEATIWGNPFYWGNDKNPWLPAALVKTGIAIGGESGIGIYFIQCLTVSLGLISIYQLTYLLSNRNYAFIASSCLLACAAFTIELQIFNDNYILMGLLPLTTLFFYYAIFNKQTYAWLFAGATLGLATMGKYHAVLLGLSLFFFLLNNKTYRPILLTIKPYLSFLIFLIVITPNLIWLFQHDFITLNYAFQERAKLDESSWLKKSIKNIDFIWATVITLLPSLLLLLTAFTTFKLKIRNPSQTIRTALQQEQLSFLFWMAQGPLLILFSLGMILGLELHREWGTGLLSLLIAYLLVYYQPILSTKSLKRYCIFLIIILILYPSAYVYFSIKNDASIFPAKKMSEIAEHIWRTHFNTPLRYVAGDRYTAGYLTLHSKDKPQVFMEWNTKASIDLSIQDLYCHGALFILDSGHTHSHFYAGKQFPDFILKQYPKLKVLPPISLAWVHPHQTQKPLTITIGLLAPNNDFCNKTKA